MNKTNNNNVHPFHIVGSSPPIHTPHGLSSRSHRRVFLLCMLVFVPVVLLLTLIPCKTFEVIEGIWEPAATWIAKNWGKKTVYEDRGSPLKVVMLGDSLMNRPMNKFRLGERIQALLPEYPLEFINCGFDGTGIEWIRNNSMPSCALPAQPDAVIMFWHTDASDTDEASLDEAVVDELHANYQRNLAVVLDSLLTTGAFVALTSTGVLGETKAALFQPHSQRFHQKLPILNQYCEMNKAAADAHNIPYINLRQALMDFVPCTQLSYAWCVTLEGEHLNTRGVIIQAKLFADTLRTWLSTSPSSLTGSGRGQQAVPAVARRASARLGRG